MKEVAVTGTACGKHLLGLALRLSCNFDSPESFAPSDFFNKE
jgi:hypothetical protein